MLAVADPIVLAACVDGTLLIVDASKTRADALRRATEAISKSGTRLLGAVINKVRRKKGDNYSYYYAYSEYGDKAEA